MALHSFSVGFCLVYEIAKLYMYFDVNSIFIHICMTIPKNVKQQASNSDKIVDIKGPPTRTT